MAANLNPAQRTAVHTLSGPLLVLAGAGTGKTRVVTYRIARLIRHGIQPQRILAVTFTNKAAREMQYRIGQLLGKHLDAQPQISTFHAHCLQILRRHISQLGYPAKFAIYDRSDQQSLASRVLRELRVGDAALRPRDLIAKISDWKCRGQTPAHAVAQAQSDREHLAAAGYRRYQTALQHLGAVDFDDLLMCTEELFRRFPDVRREEAQRFDHLLIDEYQDTNGTQYRIVKALAAGHRNLCVVGDDDQSIYSWRGAEVEHILQFKRDWPEATVVRLEENYRSTAAILSYANRLITVNRKRHDKVLRAARQGGEKPRIEQYKNEEDEARGVIADLRRWLQQPDWSPRDFAILFRTNEQPRPFEMELRRQRIPYVVLGTTSFYDRREVRDVLSYLRVLDAPEDEVSLLRILNTPPRGIGSKSRECLLAEAVSRGDPVWNVLRGDRPPSGLSAAALPPLHGFAELIRKYQRRVRAGDRALAATLQELLVEVGYRREIERLFDDPQDRENRWAAVEETVNALAAFESRNTRPTLRSFLDEVALGDRDDDRSKEKQLQKDAVALLTLHSAKGLEFPHVYMVGLENGILPHHRSLATGDDAVDEERRLCYVGMTRAQERLTLSLALARMKWGRPRESVPSQFLFEIIGQAEQPAVPQPAHRRRQTGSARAPKGTRRR